MVRGIWRPRILAIAAGALILGLVLTGWKMIQFHEQLQSINNNRRWETRLEEAGVFLGSRPILFFGDSEIALWPMAKSFGSLPIRNRGILGDQVSTAFDRYASEVANLHPSLVVLEMGTNDLGAGRDVDQVMARIDQMLSQAPNAIVCGLLPAGGDYAINHPSGEIERWNERLRALAARHGFLFVDFYSLLADDRGEFRSDLTVDGLHPNEIAYLLMTRQLRKYLAPRLSASL